MRIDRFDIGYFTGALMSLVLCALWSNPWPALGIALVIAVLGRLFANLYKKIER